MKRTLTSVVAVILVIATVFAFASCNKGSAKGIWENATYHSDKSFGNGEKMISVVVEADGQSVTFIIKTDAATLEKALDEHALIGGTSSEQYGFTLITLNGMEADWERDNAYWAVYIGEDYAQTGISFIEVEDGASYKFVWTKM